MSHPVYKLLELTGSSCISIEDAWLSHGATGLGGLPSRPLNDRFVSHAGRVSMAPCLKGVPIPAACFFTLWLRCLTLPRHHGGSGNPPGIFLLRSSL